MSFRGRGGGGGRFAGRRTYQAPIKDENGNIKKPEPPTLFPDIKVLPVLPEISMKDEELVSKRRKLDHFWELSPYYIENPKEKTVGVIAEIERYSDRYKPNVRINRPPLSSVLKLAAAYFPLEILNQGSKRARAYKGTSQWTVQPDAADLQKFDRLENLEQKAQQRGEKVGDKEPDEKKEGENEDGEEEEIEDEEEDLGDDDYNQGLKSTKRDAYGRLVLGDIITAVNGKKVSNGSDLYRILDQCKVGDVVTVEVLRGDQKEKISVTLEPKVEEVKST